MHDNSVQDLNLPGFDRKHAGAVEVAWEIWIGGASEWQLLSSLAVFLQLQLLSIRYTNYYNVCPHQKNALDEFPSLQNNSHSLINGATPLWFVPLLLPEINEYMYYQGKYQTHLVQYQDMSRSSANNRLYIFLVYLRSRWHYLTAQCTPIAIVRRSSTIQPLPPIQSMSSAQFTVKHTAHLWVFKQRSQRGIGHAISASRAISAIWYVSQCLAVEL